MSGKQPDNNVLRLQKLLEKFSRTHYIVFVYGIYVKMPLNI
jgi:hypothetical protein